MTSAASHCGICNFQNISNESVIWCFECDEGICADCLEHHRVSKASRYHSTTPIVKYRQLPVEILEISQFCSEHTEKYQTFCKKHDTACCRKCVIESHNKCIDLVAIDDVTKNVKSSNALMEMEEMLIVLYKNIEIIYQDREANLGIIREQKHRIRNNIKESRRMINSYLDKIEKELFTELEVNEEKERMKIRSLQISLQAKKDQIKSIQNNIETLKRHASDFQTFIALKYIQTDITATEKFFKAVAKSDEAGKITISCHIDAFLQNISSEITKFGNVFVETKPHKLDFFRHKEKEAQVKIPEVFGRSIDHIQIQLEKTLDTNLKFVKGCHMLPDGGMIFSAFWFGKIVVMKSDGSTEIEINTGQLTNNLTILKEDDYIAVTSCFENKVCIVDVKLKTVKKTFRLDAFASGITAKENTLIYCVHGKGIRQFNLLDESVSDIAKCKISWYSYIATFSDNLYYTNSDSNTVTCCDFKGTTKWEFKNESVLKCPSGISVDNSGNVYVVGYDSNSVVLISHDGKHYRQILSATDGLKGPSVLYFDRSNNKLLVANFHHKIFLFSIT